MSEANKAVVRKIEEAWNDNDLASLDAYFAPSFVQHSGMPGMTPSLETAKMAHQMTVGGFPDRRTRIEDIIADGDKVAVRMRMTGTYTNSLEFLGVPAARQPVDVEWISIYGLKDGKVVEHRAIIDIPTLMQQLGAGAAPA